MKIEEAKGPPASFKLLAFIRENYGTIPRFCEETGLDRIKVQKAIKGELVRVDVDFAFAIKVATSGAVEPEDWVSVSGPEAA
jgi:hypothetical protein